MLFDCSLDNFIRHFALFNCQKSAHNSRRLRKVYKGGRVRVFRCSPI